jgi:uncharacterized 2Fe-2S/4Fe-4S cluster protein (DUF4445 family)
MLLAMDVDRSGAITIALDIGTNTEIALSLPQAGGSRLLCCSCASGPAFEGAHIRDGMRAAPGAIERVQIRDDEVRVHTIGNGPPVGICGSGILDTVAQLLEAGILDERGVIGSNHPGVRTTGRGREFVLVPAAATGHGRDIVVTRSDVHEIQLAKGAIRAGVEILLAAAGLASGGIQRFIVAGAFGTYLDLDSAIRIGMFPSLPRERFEQVGNAAGAGARQMLVSTALRREAAHLAARMEYIELTTLPSFTEQFVQALMLTPSQ